MLTLWELGPLGIGLPFWLVAFGGAVALAVGAVLHGLRSMRTGS